MTLFWLIAALLVSAALILLVAPWWRRRPISEVDRDQRNVDVARQRLQELEGEHEAGLIAAQALEAARGELEQTLALDLGSPQAALERRIPRALSIAVVLVALPAIAGGMYLVVGNPDVLRHDFAAPVAQQSPAEPAMPPIAEMVEKLALRLASNPDDTQGWLMLGRSYMVLERFGEAADAFRRVRGLAGDVPAVLAQLAGAITMANGGTITTETDELLQSALQGDPMEPRGLWLSGIGALQRGNPALALQHWRKLKPLIEDDPQSSASLEQMIAEAERELAGTGMAPIMVEPRPDPEPPEPRGTAPELTVRVSVDERLADRILPDDTVFVFARAYEGPPMPLAVARRPAEGLPLAVTLNDAMAMAPGMSLSAFDRVLVGARISRSGNALPVTGDLQGETGPVSPTNADEVQVVISEIVP